MSHVGWSCISETDLFVLGPFVPSDILSSNARDRYL